MDTNTSAALMLERQASDTSSGCADKMLGQNLRHSGTIQPRMRACRRGCARLRNWQCYGWARLGYCSVMHPVQEPPKPRANPTKNRTQLLRFQQRGIHAEQLPPQLQCMRWQWWWQALHLMSRVQTEHCQFSSGIVGHLTKHRVLALPGRTVKESTSPAGSTRNAAPLDALCALDRFGRGGECSC